MAPTVGAVDPMPLRPVRRLPVLVELLPMEAVSGPVAPTLSPSTLDAITAAAAAKALPPPSDARRLMVWPCSTAPLASCGNSLPTSLAPSARLPCGADVAGTAGLCAGPASEVPLRPKRDVDDSSTLLRWPRMALPPPLLLAPIMDVPVASEAASASPVDGTALPVATPSRGAPGEAAGASEARAARVGASARATPALLACSAAGSGIRKRRAVDIAELR